MNTIPDQLVLFDGVCNLCNSTVRFIIRHDRAAIFRFAPIQSELGREIFVRHGLDPRDLQTFMLLTHGRALVRSDAAIEVLSQLGGIWRLARVLRWVPRAIRDWVYSMTARHRYAWFGRSDTCMIPTPELKRRFVA